MKTYEWMPDNEASRALDIALRLSARGLPAFPCRANKAPACRNGFKDATIDHGRLKVLWRHSPGVLVGVPTGADTFDALDIDPRHGGTVWLAAHGEQLPETRAHETRSGGQHLLFRHLVGMRNSESKIAPGVDVRGDGGYVIWWPNFGGSIIRKGPLASWPEWLAVLALPRTPAVQQPAPSSPAIGTHWCHENGRDHAARALELIGRALFSVETAPEGQRHYRLRAAAVTIGGLLDAAGQSAADAQSALLDAVKRAGAANIAGAEKTTAWGLESGRGRPLEVGRGA